MFGIYVFPNISSLAPLNSCSFTHYSLIGENTMAYGKETKTKRIKSTGDNNVDGLLANRRWKSKTVSFSFTNNFNNDYEEEINYPESYEAGFSQLNSKQRAATYDWVDMYKSVSNLNLVEFPSFLDRHATIRIAESDKPNTAEVADFPGSTSQTGSEFAAGDIWFNPNDYNNPEIGTYAYHTFGHEIGHALGLKHGHESSGVRGIPMNSDRDSMEFSIMTYRSFEGHTPTIDRNSDGKIDIEDIIYQNEPSGYAQSLMMYDIRAIQEMYGANFGHNATNTTYEFDFNTGEMFVSGVGQGQPGDNRIFRTIWDGNGIDTYDFSNYNTNLSINLKPGAWSDLDRGGDHQRADLGLGNSARGHVFNALQYQGDKRSLIENAIGGSGNDQIVANQADNFLSGGSGKDTIFGEDGNDKLYGGTGDDTLYGGAGNDRLDAWTGNDKLYGGDGNDELYGGVGNDFLTGESGNDRLDGWTGNDELYGGTGDDTLYGGAGNDRLDGWTGNDKLYGGTGHDELYGGVGNDFLTGESGNDRLDGWTGNDKLYGGTGNDTLYGGAGNDRLDGWTGNDKLYGGTGHDKLYGGVGNDFLTGESGNDRLDGWTGNDKLYGGTGNDTLYGGAGNDRLDGWTGNDKLYGGTGHDELYGGDDSDTLSGGVGDDLLVGGTGKDVLTGGLGSDRFRFNFVGEGVDRVTDFARSQGDKIEILASGFGDGLAKGLLSASQFVLGSVAVDESDRFIYNQKTGSLYFDVDGSGNQSAVKFATLSKGLNLASLDFEILGNTDSQVLIGGAGGERLVGGDGDDVLRGGDGNDDIDGGFGLDVIDGGAGSDLIRFSQEETGVTVNLVDGTATLMANDGTSYIENLISIERAAGTRFNDIFIGDDAINTFSGGDGNDTLNGGAGGDRLVGGAGNDVLKGGDGNDDIDGGLGLDVIDGGAGSDLIRFSQEETGVTVNLVDGTATLMANDGTSYIENLISIERAAGTRFNDIFIGDDAINTFSGGDGDDTLNGGAGGDRLVGGNGDDLLIGSVGNDILTGGSGADKFRFNAAQEGFNRITDFSQTQGDKIEILASSFGGGLSKGTLNASQFVLGSVATDANDRFIYDQTTGSLFFDVDGSGSQSAVQFAALSEGQNLTNSDIVIA
jgi:serralysin